MKHREYIEACECAEHKGMPVWLRNLKTGEVGSVMQCTGWDTPDVFLVKVGDQVTSWAPEEVEAVEDVGESS